MNEWEAIKNRLGEKQFNPPLQSDVLSRFEQRYGIDLPPGYSSFLLNVADGGIMIDGFRLLSLSELEIDSENITKDFPFTDYWFWESECDVNKAMLDSVEHGNIPLIDIGDAQTWNLIVSGQSAGEMWFFTDVGIQPACPRRDFISWFTYWLDGGDDYFSDFVY